MICGDSTDFEGHLRGQVVAGRYRLGGLLARGAMGVVYEAEDLRGGAPVAVKLMTACDEGGRQRMLQEIEAISAVRHPGIARIHGSGCLDEHTPFVVLDLLRGETLGGFLQREGAMPASMALPLILRCAGALGAAHAAGVVHRDIKPQNLFLLGPPGAPTDLRVVDFGLSRGAARITAPGVAVGTAEYMAPEQVMTDPVDGRADIYALGVVLFRLLAGRLPFDERDKLNLMARHLLEPAPALRLALPCTPSQAAGFAALVARCLCKLPEHRFASMAEVEDCLRVLLEGRPLTLKMPASDVYLPRSDFGQRVVGSFYRRLGRSLPLGVGEEEEEG